MLPVTTLFMLMSMDGKISTGAVDHRDFDRDLPRIPGVSEGLGQYYRLEQGTGRFSLNTGRVLAKVGWNETKTDITRLPVSFVVVDNQHLTDLGVRNMLQRSERLIVATSNRRHPSIAFDDPRLVTIEADGRIDFTHLFGQLADLGVHELTVQSGGTLNAALVRAGLINYLSVVVAPVLVGGKDTPTLLDGDPVDGDDDLNLLRPLQLIGVRQMEHSYLHLQYAVASSTQS